MKYSIVVAWHDQIQIQRFCKAWNIDWTNPPGFLVFQCDPIGEGCAKTKNKGIERSLAMGVNVVMVLDDDCYPLKSYPCSPNDPYWRPWNNDKVSRTLEGFAEAHLAALEPQPVELYSAITAPPSRGTPYFNRSVTMPVAASMGFWTTNPDYDAVRQLIHKTDPMTFDHRPQFWRFFPFSGMNCAFRSEFWPEFKFNETSDRFDDIFMGYRLQTSAYYKGYCISLNGPTVRHVRQSNVWNNLQVESRNMERNETEWQQYVPSQ